MARPRSARAHADVLDAAVKLFSRAGIEHTSMDAIAQESGVSKATIYKHWPDKRALCVEVMVRAHGSPQPAADSGDLRTDLIAVLSHQPARPPCAPIVRMLPHLFAYAARNPVFGKEWRARVVDPPRVQIARALKRAVARGELSRTLDIDAATDLLLGPMIYGHLLRPVGRRVPDQLPELVVDTFLRANGVTSRGRTSVDTPRAYRRPQARQDRQPPR